MIGRRVLMLVVALVVAGALIRSPSRPSQVPLGASIATSASTIALPTASEALASPEFRITGVHFWQGNWNYNFWSNLKPRHLERDLHRIRDLGLNTIVLTIPWGEFQRDAQPLVYNEENYSKLDEIIRAAAAEHLYVVLRVGTLERVPTGTDGTTFSAPYLFFDDRELTAYADLFRETARRIAAHENVLFLFNSWEDIMGFLSVAQQPEASRASYARRVPAFSNHLRERPIADWNRAWGTTYASHDDVPLPAYGSAAFEELLRFADQRLIESILPRLAEATRTGNARAQLSYEIRIDAEPIQTAERLEYFGHERTWKLPAGYALTTAYFNPYWEAPNQGDFIAPDAALRNLKHLLDRIERVAGGRRLFFDQFNFTDSTPAFRHNSRLRDERAIAEFLEQALPEIYRRSLGYALWSLDRHEANVLYNPSFETGVDGWDILSSPGAAVCAGSRDDVDRSELYVHLEPGCTIRQTVLAGHNPGSASPEIPYRARFAVRGRSGATATLRYEVQDGESWRLSMSKTVAAPPTWSVYEVELPFAPAFRLSMVANGDEALDLDELTVFNHVQDAALYGTRGESLGRRAQVVARLSRHWSSSHVPSRPHVSPPRE